MPRISGYLLLLLLTDQETLLLALAMQSTVVTVGEAIQPSLNSQNGDELSQIHGQGPDPLVDSGQTRTVCHRSHLYILRLATLVSSAEWSEEFNGYTLL